ncbi:VWA domain-containing protein [Cryptosporangium sp. NPDC051539]|uniref:VWA domain-containing protein n=1 Tax=Cryptosporangium sp. NPDC051539 TaxID=3363962 RepID=UPI0037AE227C
MNELLALVRDLRAAGIVISVDRVIVAAEALRNLPGDPYRALRVSLCVRRGDLQVFDAVWRDRASAQRVDAATPIVVASTAGEPEVLADGLDALEAQGGSGSLGDLTTRDVATLTDAERAEIARLIALLVPATRRRPSARRVPARHGRIDARRTVRLWLRNGGEPSRVLYTRRGWRRRRLLLLIDVSGSMSEYSEAMLRFAHAAVAASPTTTEAFAIGTRFTRLTSQLRGRDAGQAMRTVAETEADWNGGTTLGQVLRQLLHQWAGRTAVRSAIVVISSDGFEFDADSSALPAQVARLARLGHVLIWVNPEERHPGFEAINPALEDSLPYVTHTLSGHSVASLRELAELIAR